jgi:hypothetical protein
VGTDLLPENNMTPNPIIRTLGGVKFPRSDRGRRGSREIKATIIQGLHSKTTMQMKISIICSKTKCIVVMTITHVFLTKSEHDRYMSRNDDFMLETDDA